MRRIIIGLMAVAAIAVTGCTQSNADTASKNLSTAAEQFEVQRKIVGINGITDKVEFEVEGRCSIEIPGNRTLEVICKHGPNDLRKHYVGLSDNMFFISTQLEGLKVDEFRTRVILKPQSIVPDYDLVTK